MYLLEGFVTWNFGNRVVCCHISVTWNFFTVTSCGCEHASWATFHLSSPVGGFGHLFYPHFPTAESVFGFIP